MTIEDLRPLAQSLGFCRIGVAKAAPVDDSERAAYESWLARGCHASMQYLERYPDVRFDATHLLEGSRSVIVAAMSYYHTDQHAPDAPTIAAYAHGRDYHEVVRERLQPIADEIQRLCPGSSTRCCVDTAPLRERYWAVRAGIGILGRNGCIIVPGVGSWVFIGTIITTAEITAPEPSDTLSSLPTCHGCGACIKACPTGALQPDGTVDARRCLSYLTIEHRGEFPEGTDLQGRLYGCDECQRACPHNLHPEPTTVSDFLWRPELRHLTPEELQHLTPGDYRRLTRHSAISRAPLPSLKRNALNLLSDK